MAQEPDAAAASDVLAPDPGYASPQLQRYLEEQQQFAAQARHLTKSVQDLCLHAASKR